MGQGDKGTRKQGTMGQGDKGTRKQGTMGQGDEGTREQGTMAQGDEGTRGQGDEETRDEGTRKRGDEVGNRGIRFPAGRKFCPEWGEAVHSLWEGGPPCCLSGMVHSVV